MKGCNVQNPLCNKIITKIKTNHVFILLILISFSTYPQFDEAAIPKLPEPVDRKLINEKWKKYGAYYDTDEILFTATVTMGTPNLSIEFNKRIKILTLEGTKYGTIPIPFFSRDVSKFEARMFDSNGVEIPINSNQMKGDYLSTGKVVFPKVTPGSELTLAIRFDPQFVFMTFKSWFKYDIPIRVGRFLVKTTDFVYESKTFRNRYAVDTATFQNGKIKSFIVYNVEPAKDLDYIDYKKEADPTIILRLAEIKGGSSLKFNTNSLIFQNYSVALQDASNFSNSKINEFIKISVGAISDKKEQAKAILRWIQDNIRSTGKNDVSSNTLFKNQKASTLQIACLCNKMFQKIGVESKLVLANKFGEQYINSDYLFFDPYWVQGFCIVTLNNTKLVAYLYDKGYELGQYPQFYNNTFCIDVKEESVYVKS